MFIIHPSADGHLRCFFFCVTVNREVMNIDEHEQGFLKERVDSFGNLSFINLFGVL